MSEVRYTAAQWNSFKKTVLRTFSIDTLDIARAVLVEGRTPSAIARELGTSRQRVGAAVRRVRDRLGEEVSAGLVPVLAWVPPEQVEAVKDQVTQVGGKLDE